MSDTEGARHPGGRPTKFKDKYVEQAQKLAALGATDEDLANFFEVSTVTIWRWQVAHPEFCNALKMGKDAADNRVERSLYHRAIGYSHDSVKIMQHQGSEILVPYKEHVPPDTTAAIFWLKNRRKEQWNDTSTQTMELGDTFSSLLGKMSQSVFPKADEQGD